MIKKMLKKIIISLTLFIYLFSSLGLNFAKAAEGNPWYDQSFEEWVLKVKDTDNPNEIFGERYTYAQVQWIIYSLIAMLVPDAVTKCKGGDELKNCFKEINDMFNGNPEAYSPSNIGAVGVLALMSGSLLTTPPASGVEYVEYVAKEKGFIKHAEAQGQPVGFGFRSLQPVRVLWRATRDIAYSLLILAVLI